MSALIDVAGDSYLRLADFGVALAVLELDGRVVHATHAALHLLRRFELPSQLPATLPTALAFELASAPLGAGGERVYPGTCSGGIPDERARRAQRAWRVRVGDEDVAYRDRLQGAQAQDLRREVGDFVVKRADGLFAYQLAVVVDDALQAVTHVVRGADLLASTPRQIFLQRLLGYPTQCYLHVPVALDAAGEKLSKQTHARPIPGDALGALLAAWEFLDQPLPDDSAAPTTVAEFWAWAIAAWDSRRLQPVAMLPAPAEFAAAPAAPV